MAPESRTIFRDLRSARWMYLKAALLLGIGVMAAVLVWLEAPTLRTALLLVIAVWGFCRAYYFAFYVVQHYVDSEFRFAGLLAFLRYLLTRRRR